MQSKHSQQFNYLIFSLFLYNKYLCSSLITSPSNLKCANYLMYILNPVIGLHSDTTRHTYIEHARPHTCRACKDRTIYIKSIYQVSVSWYNAKKEMRSFEITQVGGRKIQPENPHHISSAQTY